MAHAKKIWAHKNIKKHERETRHDEMKNNRMNVERQRKDDKQGEMKKKDVSTI
jgi:hypothetical protein